jgi:predicted dehydrogenase
LNYVLGVKPTSVEAWGSRHAHPRHEDIAYLRLQYGPLPLTANIHVSWLDPCKVRRVTAVGSSKMAVYDDLAAQDRIRIYDKGIVPIPPESDPTQPPLSYRYGDITSPFVESHEPLAVQDGHFVECIVSGKTPLTDGYNGLAVVQVLEAAQLSLKYRQSVMIDDLADNAGISPQHDDHLGLFHQINGDDESAKLLNRVAAYSGGHSHVDEDHE